MLSALTALCTLSAHALSRCTEFDGLDKNGDGELTYREVFGEERKLGGSGGGLNALEAAAASKEEPGS